MPRRGFTLVELLCVVALLLALTAISLPSFDTMYADARQNSAADLVRARWSDARTRAGEEGRAYRYAVVPGTGRFRVEADGDALPDEETPPVLEGELPKGVTFNTDGESEGGDFQTVAVFLPDGTCRDDAEIVFRTPGARPLSLRLRALTGTVTSRAAENRP